MMVHGIGMIKKAGLALGLSMLAVTSMIGAAQAQWYGYRQGFFSPPPPLPVEPDEMSPHELTHAVRSQGFRRPSRPVYHDEVAVLNAIHPNGQPVRVTLDVYSGQIVNLTPLAQRPVPRSRPVIRETLQQRDVEPRRPKTRTVERSPEMRPPARRETPSVERKEGERKNGATPNAATPAQPTIVRRAPMLPPQDTKAPNNGTSTAAGAGSNVGAGTRAAPRQIEITPPARSDAPTPPI
jgi:hypothetical protein